MEKCGRLGTSINSELSFNYLYGYVASDLKLSDYPKDTRNIIPLEASDNSLGNLIELSDDKKWIVFKRNGRVRFNGCLSISWNNDFYLQVSVCRESNDSKGTPVPVVGVSIRSPLKQDNTFVYVDRVLRVKEGERLCFAFIIPNWCDTTGGFISRNSDRASSGLMANYVSFNDEMYVLLYFCHRPLPIPLPSPISYFCVQQKSHHICLPKKVLFSPIYAAYLR